MTTEAGKRVVGDLTIGYVSVPKGSWNECEALATVLVAAIEAEAVAAERTRIADEVRGISLPPGPGFAWVDGHKPFIAAVLRIVEEATE